MIKRITLCIMLALTGCDSDEAKTTKTNTATPNNPNTLNGLAIDGYIGGATVFLDKNFNGVLDSGEPSAVTESKTGRFKIPLSKNAVCNNNAPVIVSVPAGALDSDAPNGVVDKPYTMTLPPAAFRSQTKGNVTPITSKVWDQVLASAKREGITLSCSTLANPNSTISAWLKTTHQMAEKQVAKELNIQSSDIYSDYVKANNKALHQVAKNTVEHLKKVEELKKKTVNIDKNIFLINGKALTAYGITDLESYVLTSSLKPYGSFTKKLKETVRTMDGTLRYESEFDIHENENYYNKVGSAYFATTGNCKMLDNSVKKSKAGAWKVETTRIDNKASRLSECGSMDSTNQVIYTKDKLKGIEYQTSESHYASNIVGRNSNVGSNLDNAMSNYFTSLEGVMSGYTGFDQQGSFPAGVKSWTRSYYDHIDSNPANTFNELITYDSSSIWHKIRYQSVNEYFCFRPINELNGNPFDTAKSPVDFWQELVDRNGDAVWLKVGNSFKDVSNNILCDMTKNKK
ncbi:hypothetical protein AAIA71_11505 [Vibrio harveyi]|uniref:hypothetical protein n=1 Tax=Vibrio harveyi TaxID=669 RepID=UPI0031B9ECBF